MKKYIFSLIALVVLVVGFYVVVHNNFNSSTNNNEVKRMISLAGEVESALEGENTISVTSSKNDQEKVYRVTVGQNTKYYNSKGEQSNFEAVKKGDVLLVAGKKKGEEIEADKIIHFQAKEKTFSKKGYLSVSTPGRDTNKIYFVYEEPGSPALSAELLFTDVAICTLNNSLNCPDTSEPSDSLAGKKVNIYGAKEDEILRVLYIEEVKEMEAQDAATEEQVLVDWQLAKGYLSECRVTKIFQKHNREVFLTLKDGRELRTKEPELDLVFDLIDKHKNKCGNNIEMATE